MNIFGSIPPQIIGEKIESTNNIKQLQLKLLLDENETMQLMRKVTQAKTSVQSLTLQGTQKKSKKPTLSFANAGPPDRISVLFTKCGGCHLKEFIVAS